MGWMTIKTKTDANGDTISLERNYLGQDSFEFYVVKGEDWRYVGAVTSDAIAQFDTLQSFDH